MQGVDIVQNKLLLLFKFGLVVQHQAFLFINARIPKREAVCEA